MKRLIFLIFLFFSMNIIYSNNDIVIKTIGVLSSANVYTTYISIGVLADSYFNKVYSKEDTINICLGLKELCISSRDYIKKMIDSNMLIENDYEYGVKLIIIYNLFISQIDVLIEYINDPRDINFELFNKYKSKVIEKIENLYKK